MRRAHTERGGNYPARNLIAYHLRFQCMTLLQVKTRFHRFVAVEPSLFFWGVTRKVV